jgi:hypothetical protein
MMIDSERHKRLSNSLKSARLSKSQTSSMLFDPQGHDEFENCSNPSKIYLKTARDELTVIVKDIVVSLMSYICPIAFL